MEAISLERQKNSKKSVKSLDTGKIHKVLAAKMIRTWKSKPLYGPRFGFVWERLIQTAKWLSRLTTSWSVVNSTLWHQERFQSAWAMEKSAADDEPLLEAICQKTRADNFHEIQMEWEQPVATYS